MASIGPKLRIKYGLMNVPSDAEARAWAQRVEGLIAQGFPPAEAGRRAAGEFFDVDRLLFRTESDTIAALLAEVRRK